MADLNTLWRRRSQYSASWTPAGTDVPFATEQGYDALLELLDHVFCQLYPWPVDIWLRDKRMFTIHSTTGFHQIRSLAQNSEKYVRIKKERLGH